MQTQFVEMVHPDLPGQPYKAPQQAVGLLQMSGWQLTDQEESPPEPAADTAAEPPEAPAAAGASSLEPDQPPTRRRAPKEGE